MKTYQQFIEENFDIVESSVSEQGRRRLAPRNLYKSSI
jgi:hypothetical protein